MLIEELACHSSCYTCDGPSATDCTQCNTGTNEVLFNGDCVCNIAGGWYLDSTACVQTCGNAAYFKDDTTKSCVVACTFPLMFHYNGKCY